jgi:hypothetical protein
MWKQIASGSRSDLETAKSYEESSIAEGQRGRLVINFLIDVPAGHTNILRSTLTNAGVEDLALATAGKQLTITWRKGFAWVPVIILAVLALAILIVSWLIFKEVVNVVDTVFQNLGSGGTLLVVLLVAAVMILPYFLRKKVR